MGRLVLLAKDIQNWILGRCFATAAGGQPMPLSAGEVVVFTQGQPHIMSSQPGMRADLPTSDVLEVATAGRKPFGINYGDGPASAKLVCGYFACDARPFNPLLDSLPSMFKAGDAHNEGVGWIVDFIRIAVAEAAENHAGRESVTPVSRGYPFGASRLARRPARSHDRQDVVTNAWKARTQLDDRRAGEAGRTIALSDGRTVYTIGRASPDALSR